jgi:hypothetical protein
MTTTTGNAFARLQSAFDELRDLGIDARGPSECCGTCSRAAVPDGVSFVFWNQQAHDEAFVTQDGELLGDGDLVGDIHLSYGVADDDQPDQAMVAHGQHIVRALQSHGLDVRWSGDPTSTIVVQAERAPDAEERHIMDGDVRCSACDCWTSENELDGEERCDSCHSDNVCANCAIDVGEDNLTDGLCSGCADGEDDDDA